VTVAVIDAEILDHKIEHCESDFKIQWYSGTGCGGQNKNKVQASCRLTHIPTGITQTSQTRSRENSYRLAMDHMVIILNEHYAKKVHDVQSVARKSQVGSGMRGDKIRTYYVQRDLVSDHRTGKNMQFSRFMKGFINELHQTINL